MFHIEREKTAKVEAWKKLDNSSKIIQEYVKIFLLNLNLIPLACVSVISCKNTTNKGKKYEGQAN